MFYEGNCTERTITISILTKKDGPTVTVFEEEECIEELRKLFEHNYSDANGDY